MLRGELENVVTLLAHEREELFEGERAVRLFQFRTWIIFPDKTESEYCRWAALIAASKYLDRIEERDFADVESERRRSEEEETLFVDLSEKPPQTLKRINALRKKNTAYREMYNRLALQLHFRFEMGAACFRLVSSSPE
jgi:hypothetical protein